ncbi:MAG: regulatory protein ArsR [Bradyrhizobium sp.]|nr:regulatory protein ArsR [Bradyrhizobium sp.]
MKDVFQAVAEAHRRTILVLLADGEEHSATSIAQALTVVPQTTSQHLSILVQADLLSMRASGTHRLYRLSPAGLDPLRRWLQHFD